MSSDANPNIIDSDNSAEWKHDFVRRLNADQLSGEELKVLLQEKDALLPSKLYRFRTASDSNHLDSLSKGEEWLSSPAKFNDPFDSAFCFDLNTPIRELPGITPPGVTHTSTPFGTVFGGILDHPDAKTFTDGEKESLMSMFERMDKALPLRLKDAIRDTIRVCCLSEKFDSTLMWSHYADQHQGFVIEYDITTMCERMRRWLLPVSYADELVTTASIFETRTATNPYWRLAAVCRKAAAWHYEQEWRIAISKQPNWSIPEQIPVSSPMPKPSRVLLGIKMSAPHQAKLRAICQQRDIPCVSMAFSPNSFQLTVGPNVV